MRGLVIAHDEVIRLGEGKRKMSLKVKTRREEVNRALTE